MTVYRGAAIHLAIGAPTSGRSARRGREMAQAIEVVVDERNAPGGIGGRPVGVRVFDDRADVTTGAVIARQIVLDARIVAVIGHYDSDVSLAAAVYRAVDVAMIAPVASNPSLTDHGWPNVFRLTNRDDSTARMIARYLVNDLERTGVLNQLRKDIDADEPSSDVRRRSG